jgi:hypothetical protein
MIVKVKLVQVWLNHQPGTVLHLSPFKAQEMISRNLAVMLEEAEIEQKDIPAPPHDKQMKKAWRKEV